MADHEDLRRELGRIDGRGYPAYKDIRGSYDFPGFTLHIDHVQGDPFAAPSRLAVTVPQAVAGFPEETFKNLSRADALASYLARRFAEVAGGLRGRRGSGKSGLIEIDGPGQEVIERTCLSVDVEDVEARFSVGLPAAGRRVLGRQAAAMLCEDVPAIVERVLKYASNDAAAIDREVRTNEDADHLRRWLAGAGLVAFVAEGSLLPRRSGVDNRPMGEGAVLFEAPASLRVEVDLPNAGRVVGLGVPEGVTLIVGGGFHGKSTLLRALERGVYNHRAGDGRERVAARSGTVKVRAEDGRRVASVDISPFINNLPFGADTRAFSSDNASGSTSQAANIIEAVEAGAEVLLIDEDTAATNFMIRDHRMQELIVKAKEPITPLIDRVRQLYEERGVSTVLVVGGCGDYFDVADTVIAMEEYVPRDATAEAREVAARHRSGRRPEASGTFGRPAPRVPVAASVDARKGRREVNAKGRGTKTIVFGQESIDLSAVEQIVDPGQTRAISAAMVYAKERYMDGRRDLREVIDKVAADVAENGLDVLSPHPAVDHVAFRPAELAAALNRLRTVRFERGVAAQSSV